MQKPGRNDPCPCGSGKKYKHCCMNAQQAEPPEELRWRRVRRAIEGMADILLRFGRIRYGPTMLVEAWETFNLAEEPTDFDPQTPHLPVFMPWLFFDWQPDPLDTDIDPAVLDGLTLAQAYLRDNARRADPLLVEYLQACCAAPFSFYDVVSVRPNVGATVRDIFNGEEIAVRERSASTQMRSGDILFAKIARLKDIALFEGLTPVMIPPDRRAPVLTLRKRMKRSKKTLTQAELREWDLDMLWTYHEIVEPILNPRMPVLQNTDGDPFMPHTVVYDIASPQAAFDALADLCVVASREELLEEATRDTAGKLTGIAFEWQKTGNAKHKNWDNTILGHIAIDGARLTAKVNSENRTLRFREIMNQRLPGARYRTTSIESVESMLKRPEKASHTAAQEAADFNAQPEVQAMLTEEMRRHYREWPDTKIPLLGNRTPRQAVKSRDGRELVEGMLLQIERGIGQTPQLDPAIVREMREALGLLQKPLL
jgi:hypothetical protein